MTSLLEAYSPVATAPRTRATISGGKAMLIFSAAVMGWLGDRGGNYSYQHSMNGENWV
jgi:hypothetical protein